MPQVGRAWRAIRWDRGMSPKRRVGRALRLLIVLSDDNFLAQYGLLNQLGKVRLGFVNVELRHKVSPARKNIA